MSVDLFDGPVTAQIDPLIAAQINQIFESLTKTQQGLLAVKGAAPETEAAMRQLYQSFAAGHTSIVGVRSELERMAQGAPKTAAEIREMAKAEREAADAARPYWESLDRLNERLDKVSAGNRRAGASIGEFAASVSHGFHAIESVARTVEGVVERIAQRSAEGARLARIQAELNLSFAEAQAQSPRFVAQGEIGGLAEHFASARMRLTQEQLGALTRGASRLSTMNGTSFEEEAQRMFSGVVGGEQEVLRRLGPEMAALSGQSHTAQERLQALMHTVQELGTPVEDAASSMHRFQESVAQSERALAGGFTSELGRIAAPGGLLASFTQGLGTNEQALRDLGTTAGRYIGVAATATAGWLNLLGRIRTTIAEIHQPITSLPGRVAGAVRSAASGPLRDAATFALGAERAGSLENLIFGESEEGDAGASRATGSATADMTFNEQQRAADDRAAARLAEDRLETAQGAVRKQNDPAGVAARNFRSIDAAQRRAGAAGRRQERADWQAILNASLERKRQADADRLITWEGLREKVRVAAELQTRADEELARAIEEMRDAAARKGVANENALDEQSRAAFAEGEAGKTAAARDRMEQERQGHLGARLAQATGANMGDVGLDAEARAANDIATAWGNASDALTKHLDLVAQGRETWSDVWDGIKQTAERALIDIAMTEGKVELGRALGALAVGNFAGAGLHLAAGAALLAIGGATSYLTGGAGDADRAAEKEAKKTSRGSSRVPRMDSSASGSGPAPVTISVSFGGASFYGSGGPRQAAAELVGLLNTHAPLSGAVLDARVTGRA